ncbi:MAG: heme ABC transporter permease [Arenicellales bacterium]
MTTESLNTSGRGKKWLWFHRFGSPAWVYGFANRWAMPIGIVALLLFVVGLYQGLIVAPPDYQMGDSYRIIFIHVPSAWLSMFSYFVMAASAGIGLVWHIKVSDLVARSIAPLGAMFTFCALVTGSLWGKPTWGTYWVWDARLTSELVLLFLFIGYIALSNAIEDRRTASRASAVLALVGVINLPIIHFSVEWWNTLHQGSTVTKLGRPSIDTRMLIPLLIMFVAFNFYFLSAVLNRLRCELLSQERRTQWVREIVHG